MNECLDVYADSTQIGTTPYDLTLYFSKRPAMPNSTQAPIQVGCVRLSLEHAKVLAIMLRKSLKTYEEAQGAAIKLHPNAVQGVGISVEEDW
jgi:hypothetical protein